MATASSKAVGDLRMKSFGSTFLMVLSGRSGAAGAVDRDDSDVPGRSAAGSGGGGVVAAVASGVVCDGSDFADGRGKVAALRTSDLSPRILDLSEAINFGSTIPSADSL